MFKVSSPSLFSPSIQQPEWRMSGASRGAWGEKVLIWEQAKEALGSSFCGPEQWLRTDCGHLGATIPHSLLSTWALLLSLPPPSMRIWQWPKPLHWGGKLLIVGTYLFLAEDGPQIMCKGPSCTCPQPCPPSSPSSLLPPFSEEPVTPTLIPTRAF